MIYTGCMYLHNNTTRLRTYNQIMGLHTLMVYVIQKRTYVNFVCVLHRTIYTGCMYLHTKQHTTYIRRWYGLHALMECNPYHISELKGTAFVPLLLVATTSYFTILSIDTLFYLISCCVYYFITMFIWLCWCIHMQEKDFVWSSGTIYWLGEGSAPVT